MAKNFNVKKKANYYLVFLIITIAVYVVLSPQSMSTAFLNIILFGITAGLSLAFFFSVIISRDKAYIRSLQEQEVKNQSLPLKNIESSVKQLSKTLDSTVTMLSKQQTPSSPFQSLPINFSIIPSYHSNEAFIIDSELKIPFQDQKEKNVYNKLVRLLKKNGHNIRILKPYNPHFMIQPFHNNDEDDDLSLNAISSDFPQNLINFN
ncbi:hypothetical protein CL657_03685 [bacterium]|nr:hypothetical protein [bacterium]|tara:strand:- start:383 stop:1000 length:618 start_codon:yes stop_codon:yes gene_type:complete